jgi:exopolyphosphatase / guanosine-5'-triphosphate,3'-diphosphate pyrophosphatase
MWGGMRIAIIDLGTNSVRFDIHQLGLKRKVQTLYREKLMVRLGQGVFVKGQLDRDAIYRTTHAFSTFKRIAEEFSVNHIVAIGTSALREAVDGQKLVNAIKRRTGIEIKIISGTEEARLIALGVLSNEKRPRGKAGLVDIGGGSTEICVFRGMKLLQCESLPLGTARLQQVFLKKSPPTKEDIEELRVYVQKTAESRLTDKKWPKTKVGIGSSGTVRALGKILRRITGSKYIERKELELLNKKMAKMTTTQLLGLPGVESKRVDMILAGSILLEEMMFAMGLKKIMPTEFSLRDGILMEQVEIAYKNFSSGISFHLPDLMEKAKKLGNNVAHIQEVLENARILFKKLKPLHKLDPRWLIYLEAAIVLRNVGESVSLVGHPEHSYYIVKNSKFPFINEWESELVAELCLHHEDHKLEMKTVPFKKDGKFKQVYLKLLALICIIDALDADTQAVVKIRSVRLDNKNLKIFLTKGSASDLEIFRTASRREIIEKILKRNIELVRN